MNVTLPATLAQLRAAVGYLGERDQHGWWESSFFVPSSRAFLAPVFSRTQTLAQCMGVTRAAMVVHDGRIGLGRVYHIFRLPEDMEQAIHRVLHDPGVGRYIADIVASWDSALAHLEGEANKARESGVGPIHLGDDAGLRDRHRWSTVATHYAQAFAQGEQVYPYMSKRI